VLILIAIDHCQILTIDSIKMKRFAFQRDDVFQSPSSIVKKRFKGNQMTESNANITDNVKGEYLPYAVSSHSESSKRNDAVCFDGAMNGLCSNSKQAIPARSNADDDILRRVIDENARNSSIARANEAAQSVMSLSVLQRLLQIPHQAEAFIGRIPVDGMTHAIHRTKIVPSDRGMTLDPTLSPYAADFANNKIEYNDRCAHLANLNQRIGRLNMVRDNMALLSFLHLNTPLETGKIDWETERARVIANKYQSPAHAMSNSFPWMNKTELEQFHRVTDVKGRESVDVTAVGKHELGAIRKPQIAADTTIKKKLLHDKTSGIDSSMTSGDGNTSNFGYDAGRLVPLSMPSDDGSLSNYQCLLRQQICLFEAGTFDINCTAQGRNKPVQIGQVGIVCRHCVSFPPGLRSTGSVYFPTKLKGLYQSVQNMGKNHFLNSCRTIPEEIRSELFKLKDAKPSMLGGGKQFWAYGARLLGVVEDEDVLRFQEEKHKTTVLSSNANDSFLLES
jgi:hypothetical protein